MLDSQSISVILGLEKQQLRSRCPIGCYVLDQVPGMGRIDSGNPM